MRIPIHAVALAATLLAAAPAMPAEIKVLAYNAVNIPARELAAVDSGGPAPVAAQELA